MVVHRAHIGLVMGLVAGVSVATSAGAQGFRTDNWTVSPSLSLEADFTNNAFLAGDSEPRDTDLLLRIVPAVSVFGQGARVSAGFNGSLSRSHSVNGVQGGHTSVSLLGSGRAEWLEDAAFLNAQLSVQEQVTRPDRPSSTSVSGLRTNHTTTYSMNLEQVFRQRLSSFVNGEATLRYSPTITAQEEAINSQTILGRAKLSSGSWFQRFRWSVQASQSETRQDGRLSAIERRTVDSNYTLAVARSVSLLGGVGYEEFRDETLAESPDGTTWNAGLEVRPGRRTSIRATYGERYGRENISFDGRYNVSPRTSFQASFSQSLETDQESLLNDLSFLYHGFVDGELRLIDSRTGRTFNPARDMYSLQSVTYFVDRFSASASFSGRRNSLTLHGGWTTWASDLPATGTGSSAKPNDRTTSTAGLSYSRQLSRRLKGSLGANASRTEYSLQRDRLDDQYTTSFSLSYIVAKLVTLSGGYGYVLRDSSEVGAGYREHSAFIRFTRQF